MLTLLFVSTADLLMANPEVLNSSVSSAYSCISCTEMLFMLVELIADLKVAGPYSQWLGKRIGYPQPTTTAWWWGSKGCSGRRDWGGLRVGANLL